MAFGSFPGNLTTKNGIPRRLFICTVLSCFACHVIAFIHPCPDADPDLRGCADGHAIPLLQPPLRPVEADSDLWAICEGGTRVQAVACSMVCMEGPHFQST